MIKRDNVAWLGTKAYFQEQIDAAHQALERAPNDPILIGRLQGEIKLARRFMEKVDPPPAPASEPEDDTKDIESGLY